MTLPQVLGLSVVAAIVTTIGSLIALFLKEYVFSRSFERWKNRNTSQQVYEKYREPIVLAALELCRRLHEVCTLHPADYLNSELLGITPRPQKSNCASDTYFRQYMLLSTIFRLCAFLGWLENYRNEIVFLGSNESPNNRRFEVELANVRSDLADGRLNTAPDWDKWTDSLIFREEQRAIGEVMLIQSNGVKSIIGYGKFVEAMQNTGAPSCYRWFDVVVRFFVDPVKTQDFRLVRYQRLVVHLVSLIEALDSRRVSDEFKAWKREYGDVLNAYLAVQQGHAANVPGDASPV